MSSELEASILGAVLGALLGALAGGVVSHLSERMHESRRRKQMLRDQLSDLAIEFEADVTAYWSSEGADVLMQSKIIGSFNKLRVKITQLGIDVVADREVRFLIKEIYQFATGGTFATKQRAPDMRRAMNVQKRLGSLSEILSNR
ncbi:hypothetical protein [Lysobacter sp. F6437]|uniref:hypothetical protein n=1 Tax=Lysobacter sp. F6437 TaxID=3459296 RepID=UPI00403DBF93